jgi:hypothetical protein
MGKGSIVGFEWIWEYRNYDWNLTRRILRTAGGRGVANGKDKCPAVVADTSDYGEVNVKTGV